MRPALRASGGRGGRARHAGDRRRAGRERTSSPPTPTRHGPAPASRRWSTRCRRRARWPGRPRASLLLLPLLFLLFLLVFLREHRAPALGRAAAALELLLDL